MFGKDEIDFSGRPGKITKALIPTSQLLMCDHFSQTRFRIRWFRLRPAAGAASLPGPIEIRVAYHMPDGNPLTHYSLFDFIFDEGRTGPLQFTHRGIRFDKREGNHLIVVPDAPDFDLAITGFRTISGDLFSRATEMRAEP